MEKKECVVNVLVLIGEMENFQHAISQILLKEHMIGLFLTLLELIKGNKKDFVYLSISKDIFISALNNATLSFSTFTSNFVTSALRIFLTVAPASTTAFFAASAKLFLDVPTILIIL